jgi:proteasome lid subunit RPN8/RPN11
MKLKFSPDAWAKLLYFQSLAKTELSGFALTHPNDPLYIMEFHTIKQECTTVTTEMDDDDIARYFDEQLQRGYEPKDFSRIWLHTHPGGPTPSTTDEQTFSKVFDKCNWSIMFILGSRGQTYCRLKTNVEGLGVIEQQIETEVSFLSYEFDGIDFKELQQEFTKNVKEKPRVTIVKPFDRSNIDKSSFFDKWLAFDEYLPEAEANKAILSELSSEDSQKIKDDSPIPDAVKQALDGMSPHELEQLIYAIEDHYALTEV